VRSKRRCKHISTGVVYDSAVELSKALNISIHKVYHILNGRNKDSIGIEYIGESLVGTTVSERRCSKCNIVKPREDFGVDKRTNTIRGYSCKKCRSKRESLRRTELGTDEMRIRRIKSKYNLRREEAINLLSVTNCSICDIKLTKAIKKM